MFDFISYELVSHQYGFHSLKYTQQQRYMSVLKCSMFVRYTCNYWILFII